MTGQQKKRVDLLVEDITAITSKKPDEITAHDWMRMGLIINELVLLANRETVNNS